MNQTHPALETLVAYCETPKDRQYTDVALHVAQCSECRQAVSSVKQVLDQLENLVRSDIDLSSNIKIPDETIVQFVKGKLKVNDANDLRTLMKSDSGLTKRVLYQIVNSPEESELSHNLKTDNKNEINNIQEPPKSIQNQLNNWFSETFAARVTVPITSAAVAALITFAVLVDNKQESGIQIIAYQDDPTVKIMENSPRPGIGFFSNAETKKVSFSNVEFILSSNQQVLMTWPKIKSALNYQVNIKKFHEGKVSQFLSTSTTANSINISQSLDPARYEWTIQGKTETNQTFEAIGGFVIK